MKIEYIEGDLFTTEVPNIMHGCNAQGVMGSGVARIIRDEYTPAYDAYIERHQRRGLEVGQIQWVTANGKNICNAITQEYYGREVGRVYVSYVGLRHAMRRVSDSLIAETDNRVAMPKIGAGLANGDWDIIANIIEEEAIYFKPIVYVL
jgi:O-acetyl-ADP-ribose deacetylase (regulator of RNase III)